MALEDTVFLVVCFQSMSAYSGAVCFADVFFASWIVLEKDMFAPLSYLIQGKGKPTFFMKVNSLWSVIVSYFPLYF